MNEAVHVCDFFVSVRPTADKRLSRVLGVKTCSTRDGRVRIIACIEYPRIIEKILAHLDAKVPEPEGPERTPCRARPGRRLFD